MNARLSFHLLLSLLFVGCASVEAPKGGPEDKYPPRVAGVYPAPNSVEAPLELNVHLQFDEWIATSVPRSAVSISPPLEKKLKFEVDGDELFITSKARLDSNTTYTLTIASGLKDLHGNSVADPFRLTFSTGKVIDSLSVSGNVLVTAAMIKQKQYPSIGLFLLGKEARATRHYLEKYKDTTGVIPDSVPRLTTEPPLFITQSDSLGRFRLGGLRPGRYRVVSFLDVNGNQKIEPSAEWAGLAESDIFLDSLFKDTLWIPLADQDTSLVNLESVTQVGKSALSAKFSRNLVVDSALTSKGNCKLSTPDSSKIYPSKIFRSPRGADIVFFFDSLANKDSSYSFSCLAGSDSLGRFLDPRLSTLSVDWVEMKADTLPPRRTSSMPPNGEKDVLPNKVIEFTYDKPVSDSLLDSLKSRLIIVENKDTLDAFAFRVDPVRFNVRAKENWPTDAKVEILERYADSTLSPANSDGKRDTVVTQKTRQWIKFETAQKLKLASLQGKIPGGTNYAKVRLRRTDSDKFFVARCGADGSFKIDGLLEGKYLMDYFFFKGSSDAPFAGKLSPLEPGLAWRTLSDTLVINRGVNTLDSVESRMPRLMRKK